jgi:hypothetical protein
VEVGTTTFAEQIGVIRRRTQAHGASGASKCVAKTVGQVLKLVSSELDLVLENHVMRWLRSTLETLMGKQEEVKQLLACDTTIDDGTGLWVASLPVRVSLLGRVEAGVMPLANNNDRDFRMAFLRAVHRCGTVPLRHHRGRRSLCSAACSGCAFAKASGVR